MKPSPAADRLLLDHMLECIARICEYAGQDRQAFFGSTLIQDAVARNLQTLAESSQRLSDASKAAEPTIAWRDIAGFRNVLVHGYLAINLDAVWRVVDQDLAPLAQALERMRNSLDGREIP